MVRFAADAMVGVLASASKISTRFLGAAAVVDRDDDDDDVVVVSFFVGLLASVRGILVAVSFARLEDAGRICREKGADRLAISHNNSQLVDRLLELFALSYQTMIRLAH